MRSLSSGPEQAKLSGRGNAREVRICWGRGSGGMPPRNFFGILDALRSILVHFGTLVYHGKVHVINDYSIYM